MDMNRWRWVPVVCLCVSLGGPALRTGDGAAALGQDETDPGAPGLDLRPLWRRGQLSRYRITQTEVTQTEAAFLPEPQRQTMELEVEVSWEVLEADSEGGGAARMRAERIVMSMTDAQGQTHRATATESDEMTEPYRQWIRAMTAAPVEVEVGPDGMIRGVRGYEAIQRRAGDLGQFMDEQYFRNVALELAVLSGGRAGIEPGRTWRHRHESSHEMGRVRYETTYTLEGVEPIAGIGVAQVEVRSEVGFEPEPPDLPPEAPELEIRFNGGQRTGQILFDLSRHEVVGAHFDESLELELRRSLGGQMRTLHVTEATSTQVLRTAER